MSSNEGIAQLPTRKAWPSFVLWWLAPPVAAAAVVFEISRPPGSLDQPLRWLLLFCVGLGAFVGFDLAMFKLPYSVLGPLQRTPLPIEEPLFGWDRKKQMYSNLVRIERIQAACTVYPSGLAFKSLAARSAFIPLVYVDGLDEAPFGHRVLLHHSPEVRSHIVLYDPELIAFLEGHLAKTQSSPKV